MVFRRPQSNPSAAEEAEQLYAKACKLGHGSACRKEVAVYIPSRREEYTEACMQEDDAVACHKVARVLTLAESSNPLWWSCTTRVPSKEEEGSELKSCADGDAFACAKRGGSLAVDPGYLVELEVEPAEDSEKAALECGEGDDNACRAGARAFAAAGNWGCGTALLIEACARGKTELCGFHHGD